MRWIDQKDKAMVLLMLTEARRMEDLYFQTRKVCPNQSPNEQQPREGNVMDDDCVEVPPILRKRKLNGRPKYKIKGCCLPPDTGLTSNLDERKYRVGLRRLRKMRKSETQPNSAEGMVWSM